MGIMNKLLGTAPDKPKLPPVHAGGTRADLFTLNDVVRDRFEDFEDQKSQARTAGYAAYERVTAAQEELQRTENILARFREQALGLPRVNDLGIDGLRNLDQTSTIQRPHTLESDELALVADVKSAKRKLAKAKEANQAASDLFTHLTKQVESMSTYLDDHVVAKHGGRVELEMYEPPEDGDVDIEALRLTITATKGEYAKVLASPEPMENVIDAIIMQVDERAAKGAPRVRIHEAKPVGRGDRKMKAGPPTIVWPIAAVPNAESRYPGDLPNVTDAAALAAWLHRDAIVKALTEDIERQYAGKTVMTASERRDRLMTLRAALLEHELRECAAVRAQGGQYRSDASGKALLGIAGILMG